MWQQVCPSIYPRMNLSAAAHSEHLGAEKPSRVSLRCKKLMRFKKVTVEVLRFVSAFFLLPFKKKAGRGGCSTRIVHEPYFLTQKAGLRGKKCIIPLYLHNPALLKAGEPPSDLKISMLSPSVSLLSFRKTGKCADT